MGTAGSRVIAGIVLGVGVVAGAAVATAESPTRAADVIVCVQPITAAFVAE